MAYTTVNSSGQVFDQGRRVFSGTNPPSWNDVTNKPTLLTEGSSVSNFQINNRLSILGSIKLVHSQSGGTQYGPSIGSKTNDCAQVQGKLYVYSIADDAISTNGGITAKQNISAYSDVTLKQNVMPLVDGLGICRKLRGYTYQFKDEPDKECVGVIAQEVQKVLPQLVKKHEDILTVQYDGLIPVLLEAIRTLDSRLTALERIPRG